MSVKRKWKTWANQNIDDRRKLQDAVRQDHQSRRDVDRGRHDLQLLRRRLQLDVVGREPWRRPPGGLLATSPANSPKTTCSFPTTAPPSVCDTMEDGTPLAVGKEWKSPNGCKGCRCDSASGKAVCWVQDCAPVACANPVSTPGVCCHTCPNGKVISVLKVR